MDETLNSVAENFRGKRINKTSIVLFPFIKTTKSLTSIKSVYKHTLRDSVLYIVLFTLPGACPEVSIDILGTGHA